MQCRNHGIWITYLPADKKILCNRKEIYESYTNKFRNLGVKSYIMWNWKSLDVRSPWIFRTKEATFFVTNDKTN